MKLYCERCEAEGVIENGFDMIYCPNCDGMGYTESKEIEKLIGIGRATKKVFEQKDYIVAFSTREESQVYFEYQFANAKELLEWFEREE